MKTFIIDLCKALPGLGISFIFLLFGEWLNKFFKTPFPDVILGMIVFLFFLTIYQLYYNKIPAFIKNSSEFLLPLLPLFILPSCLGILAHLDLLKDDALKIIIALLIGIVLTQLITPFIFSWSLKLFSRKT